VFRYFVELGYDGEAYSGWQRQLNAISVQQVIEETLSKVLRLPAVTVLGSGRTDAGVHARKQVMHLDLPVEVKRPQEWIRRLNVALPQDIVLKSIRPVAPDAHARFGAELRAYEYWLSQVPDPFLRGRAHFLYQHLDFEAMNTASECLLGDQDFESFSKVHTDVNHFMCNVSRAEWKSSGQDLWVFHISADRFLRGMVRAIVGTLLQVGLSKITILQFEEIVASKSRKKAGQNAPACGLYLTEVKYPESLYVLNQQS